MLACGTAAAISCDLLSLVGRRPAVKIAPSWMLTGMGACIGVVHFPSFDHPPQTDQHDVSL